MLKQWFTKQWMLLSGLLLSVQAHAEITWNFPTPATPMAEDTLHVHNKFMLIVMVIFLVVLGIMIYSLYNHRKSKGFKPAKFEGPSNKSQLFWTLVPFAILLYIDFILMGIPAYHSVVAMEDTKTNADMVVKVTGSQWRWQYEYMDGDAQGVKFVSNLKTSEDEIYNKADKNPQYLLDVDNHLVLPVDKKVRILLTSTDVIHNWWVPAFGAARDAIPGFLRETWVKIDKPGIYRGQCKELCGKGHGFMPVVVEAVPEDEYKVWVETQKVKLAAAAEGATKEWTKDELVAQGKEVYAKNCQVCHQANGKGLPPAFPSLVDSAIVKGKLLDDQGKLLKDSHLDRVLNGKGVMPAWKSVLNDVDIAAVITYERNDFGGVGDVLQPAQVKALR